MNSRQEKFRLQVLGFFFFATIAFLLFLIYEDIRINTNNCCDNSGFPFAILIFFAIIASCILGYQLYSKMMDYLDY